MGPNETAAFIHQKIILFHRFSNVPKYLKFYYIGLFPTKCDHASSREFIARSGVPQGSIWGSLFFNLYLNDIIKKHSVNYLLYVDYFKLYSVINSQLECSVLQDALLRVNSWPVPKIWYYVKAWSNWVHFYY